MNIFKSIWRIIMAIAKKVFELLVQKKNRPPVIEDIPNQVVKETEPLELVVTASDPDGDPITLTATGLPAGATFTDNGDGTATLRYTPNHGDAGTYNIEVTADDGVVE
jgi:hypothetical protein